LAPPHCMGWISLQHTRAGLHPGQELCCCGLTTAGARLLEGRGSTRTYRCLPMPRR